MVFDENGDQILDSSALIDLKNILHVIVDCYPHGVYGRIESFKFM